MLSNQELLNTLMEKLTDRVADDLKESLARALEKELTKNLSQMLLESEFYRQINTEMQSGLRDIYKEISQAKSHGAEAPAPTEAKRKETHELFTEASDQLDKILQTTETATENIMDIVEKHMDMQAQAGLKLAEIKGDEADPAKVDELIAMNNELNQDLMSIMTHLSFQDLTGQRIKRIIEALHRVEDITFNLFVSTGLKIRAQEENPDKSMEELDKETKAKVSELKGPQTDVKQDDVDDLLSQLGLD